MHEAGEKKTQVIRTLCEKIISGRDELLGSEMKESGHSHAGIGPKPARRCTRRPGIGPMPAPLWVSYCRITGLT